MQAAVVKADCDTGMTFGLLAVINRIVVVTDKDSDCLVMQGHFLAHKLHCSLFKKLS